MRLYEIIQEGDKWANAQGSRINWDDQGNAQVPRDVMMKYQALQKDDPEAYAELPDWQKTAYKDQFARTGIQAEDPRVIASRNKKLGKDQTAVASTGVEPNFSTPKPNTAADAEPKRITQYTVRRDANKVSTADIRKPKPIDVGTAIAGVGADVESKPTMPMGGIAGVIRRKQQK
tara:strand:+ start:1193 stop:1717 length:525 start_codon:yes stop_codon:yes gene_type:complete